MPTTILLLEDDDSWRDNYKGRLQGRLVEVLEATTVEEGRQLVAARPDISIIVCDGELKGTQLAHTIRFVVDLRYDGFSGHIIAASSNPKWREQLVEAGCNHNIGHGGGKWNALPKLIEVLDLIEGGISAEQPKSSG